MKILLEDSQLLNVYLRYRELLERSDKYDIIVSINNLTPEILNDYKKILVIERMDSAGIGVKVRRVLDHPHIKNVLKMYCMADRENHNKPAVSGRLFLNSLYPDAPTELYDIKISENGFSKIISGFNFLHYNRFDKLFSILNSVKHKTIKERYIDLFYAGTTQYRSPLGIDKYITEHRSVCVQNIRRIGENINVEAYTSLKFSYNGYIRKMLNTKVILSPFGWGEFCHRDYEALLCGCILVKPHYLKVMQTPDISKYIITLTDFDSFSENDYNTIMARYQDNQQEAIGFIYKAKKDEQSIMEDILK